MAGRAWGGVQVWQEAARAQLLRVRRFEPHRAAAAAGMSLQEHMRAHRADVAEELGRVRAALLHARMRLFRHLDTVLAPEAAAHAAEPVALESLASGSACALSPVPSMAALLTVGNSFVGSSVAGMPRLYSTCSISLLNEASSSEASIEVRLVCGWVR
jgi:hypothetical protein